MPFGFGIVELVTILIIVGATFGATKLPSIGDSLEALLHGSQPPPRLVLVRRSRWTLRHTIIVVAAILIAATTALPILTVSAGG